MSYEAPSELFADTIFFSRKCLRARQGRDVEKKGRDLRMTTLAPPPRSSKSKSNFVHREAKLRGLNLPRPGKKIFLTTRA